MYKKTVVFSFAMLALLGCKNDNEVDPIELNPELTLDNPEAADWLSEGTLEASGRAVDLESLTVNDEVVDIVDNRYEHAVEMVHGLNVVEVKGVDANGDEHFVRHGALAGTFESPGDLVGDAVALRVNQGGLEDAFGAVTAMIEPEALEGAITNPVYDDSPFTGIDVTVSIVDIDDLDKGWTPDGIAIDFGSVSAWPDPGEDGLAVDINIPDLTVELLVDATAFGFDWLSVESWAWVSAEMATLCTLSPIS